MNLSIKQKGVLKGMLIGFVISLVTILMGMYLDPFEIHRSSTLLTRLHVLCVAAILPTLILIISVGRLAKHRFFHAEDIDGSGLTEGSEKAKILQSLLQNTLEQWVIALSVYVMWCMLMPAKWLSSILLCAVLFAVGRLLFFTGYSKGAAHRAIGFTLCFYASILLWLFFISFLLIDGLS